MVGNAQAYSSTMLFQKRKATPIYIMSAEDFSRYDSLKLFMHQIYEFRKGVRQLVLCTMCTDCAKIMRDRLDDLHIDYLEQPVTTNKVNLYFGNKVCLDVVKTFIHKSMNALTPAEDFMLGTMLGYDLAGQCVRFCKRSQANEQRIAG